MSDIAPLERPNNPSSTAGYGTDGFIPAYYTSPAAYSSSTATATSTSSAQPTSTLPPITPEEEADYLHKHHASTSGATGVLDYERLKFRLVFILWPAIVGITMAL